MNLGRISSQQFQTVLNKLAAQQLPATAAFKVKKILKITAEELKTLEEIREEIIQTYAERLEDGTVKTTENGGIQLDLSKKNEWAPRLEELYRVEVELPKILIKELGDKVQLSAMEMMVLDGLVDE